MEDGYEYRIKKKKRKNGHYSKKTKIKGGFYERTRNSRFN